MELGVVHGEVGVDQRVLGGGGFQVEHHHADGAREHVVMPRVRERALLDVRDQLGGCVEGMLRVCVREDDGELVAAEPGEDVRFAQPL